MKVQLLILTVVFVALAGLQVNNPQPVVWTTAYLAVASCCALVGFGRYPKWWLWGITAVLGIWALYNAPNLLRWAEGGFPDLIEEPETTSSLVKGARDFMGLLIGFVVMLFLTFHRPQR